MLKARSRKEPALEKISRERFIRLGTALGVGAAGASLAACGGSASSGGGSGGKGSDDGGGGYGGGNSGDQGGKSAEKKSLEKKSPEKKSPEKKSPEKKSPEKKSAKKKSPQKDSQAATPANAIASESDVAPGSAVTFKDAGSPAVLVHLDSGDFVAYSAVCTHQGCTVAYKNGQLACPCHGSVFDPSNGAAVIAGPASQPLPEIPVKVQGDDIVKA
jgi:arsenite oxidase small subunit